MNDQEKRKAAAIARIKAIPKCYQCNRCDQQFTVLPSLYCNCGGNIKPIKGDER